MFCFDKKSKIQLSILIITSALIGIFLGARAQGVKKPEEAAILNEEIYLEACERSWEEVFPGKEELQIYEISSRVQDIGICSKYFPKVSEPWKEKIDRAKCLECHLKKGKGANAGDPTGACSECHSGKDISTLIHGTFAEPEFCTACHEAPFKGQERIPTEEEVKRAMEALGKLKKRAKLFHYQEGCAVGENSKINNLLFQENRELLREANGPERYGAFGSIQDMPADMLEEGAASWLTHYLNFLNLLQAEHLDLAPEQGIKDFVSRKTILKKPRT